MSNKADIDAKVLCERLEFISDNAKQLCNALMAAAETYGLDAASDDSSALANKVASALNVEETPVIRLMALTRVLAGMCDAFEHDNNMPGAVLIACLSLMTDNLLSHVTSVAADVALLEEGNTVVH